MIGAPVITSDGVMVGSVSAVNTGANGAASFVAEVGAPIGMSSISVAVPVRASASAAGQVQVQDTRAEFEAFLEANGSASIQ